MTDLGALARRSFPSFDTRQASSYDRASKESGTPEWFANADAGQYIRIEEREGHKEYVMADLRGPGSVVRIWSANPTAVMRWYFDGETKPSFEMETKELLTGKTGLFPDPFAYMSARGCNLYFPIPYSRSLKITVDDQDNNSARGMYYHVNYRTYVPGTKVVSFSRSEWEAADRELIDASEVLLGHAPAAIPESTKRTETRITVPGGKTQPLPLIMGPGAIVKLRLNLSPIEAFIDAPSRTRAMENALRLVRITAKFDGDASIDVPVGDFFSSAPGINPFDSLPFSVGADGWMECRFVMPFGKSAEFAFRNDGRRDVSIITDLSVANTRFTKDNYHFKSQWLIERGSSRPMRDMVFLHAGGEGRFVGSMLQVANPTSAWWGEGDEKFYIDGEKFPSTFGTGTEDYYGYAWCDPTPFVRAYHAQTRCDGPGNRGQTAIARWHVLDSMPYKKSLNFDMELWHWREVEVTTARTVYWYALPKASGPQSSGSELAVPVIIEAPAPIPGAIEGEKLRALGTPPGVVEAQGSFEDCSNSQQLWWRDGKPGETLVIEIPVPETGRYEITGNFCYANDYGIHEVEIAGLKQEIDFFGTLSWKKVTLGVANLTKGTAQMKVTVKGKNEKAIPRHMFGLDYLILKRVTG